MKKSAVILILSFLSITTIFGQKRGRSSTKIDAYRIAFFTERLNLTETEAKDFWPVYDAYQKELKVYRNQQRALHKANYAEMSDKELKKVIDKQLELKQKQLDLEKRYYQKFQTVLPMAKVVKLPQVERAFKTALLKRMKEGRKRQ